LPFFSIRAKVDRPDHNVKIPQRSVFNNLT